MLNNPIVKQAESYIDLLDVDDFVPKYLPKVHDPDTVTSFVMRPVAYATFTLNYFFGGNNPVGYRLVNILIHVCNSVMLYLLILNVLRQRAKDLAGRSLTAVPFFAAALFLVHPLQTESVTYIVQRFTSLGTFFYLGTLLLYLKSTTLETPRIRFIAYIVSIFMLLLGLLTKEFVVTAPFSILLIELLLLKNKLRYSLIRLIPHFVVILLIPLQLYIISQDLSGEASTVRSLMTASHQNGYSTIDYGITQLRVILSYLRLFIMPYNQNFFPEYQLFDSVINQEIILSIMIWVIFISASVVILRSKNRTVFDDLVVFAVFWFLLLIMPSSSVIALPDLMAEHRTYLPSIAFCTGITAHFYSLKLKLAPQWSSRFVLLACLPLLLFSVLTVQRNLVYSSRFSLWSDTALKSPGRARPLVALGNYYKRKGNLDKAVESFEKAIFLRPDYIETYLSLGKLYQDNGKSQKAIELYESFLESNEPSRRVLTNLALAYSSKDLKYKALGALDEALKIAPADVRLNLLAAETLMDVGMFDVASYHISRANELDKNNHLVDYSKEIKIFTEYCERARLEVKPFPGEVTS
ncbi:MAG: tetratricopeptide repeat protein [Desulfuromonadaceae bacterium]|nr:tetratricopeptide repeat protein [Desulfuromonadaceae bacterium]MDD2854329.1 tetratricopeptide repeat protein [Desulfuromonadaceae bacterium]